MLDGIRRRKITLLFLVLDADENGFIERKDFERVADELAAMRGGADDGDFAVVRKSFTKVFDSIHLLIDKNDDNRVELDEWMRYFERVLASEERYADLIEPMARNIFRLLDHNDDGTISLTEFQHFAKVYRISEDVSALFGRLDTNGNGVITREEFGHMITDFFLSDDPQRPGNFIFGKYE